MAVKADIKAAANWFNLEKKQLAFVATNNAGEPEDVSTWQMRWALMKKPQAQPYLIEKDTATGGITVEEGPEGIDNLIVVTIMATEYDLVKPGVELYHELYRYDASAEGTLAFGFVTINKSGFIET
jgi:hypothetical protein